MAQNVCRGCVKPLTSASNAKNIFTDDFTVNDTGKSIKIYVGMELITGQKVLKSHDLSENICEFCFKKLGVCVNFRTQLLNSFNALFKSSTNQEIISMLDTKNNQISLNLNDENVEFTNINTEDQINVDDNSSSNEISEDEGIMRSIREEQDNNNFNLPESPVIYANSYSPKDNLVKSMDNDIESDIDVCSGEDDEILELDVNDTKNEPIDLDNSSGSDIDVCDYEPSGKRIKNYNTLSPPIQF